MNSYNSYTLHELIQDCKWWIGWESNPPSWRAQPGPPLTGIEPEYSPLLPKLVESTGFEPATPFRAATPR